MVLHCGVMGYPVAHSLSPILHQAAYHELGLDNVVAYDRVEVTPQEGPEFIKKCAQPHSSWSGLSVTMPHKQTLMERMDVLDPLAKVVGALNTIVFSHSAPDDEALTSGFNTDVEGIVEAVRDVMNAEQIADIASDSTGDSGRALILGSGATACSSLAALTQLGYSEISVAARRHYGEQRTSAAAQRMGLTIETHSLTHESDDNSELIGCPEPTSAELVPALREHITSLCSSHSLMISTLPKGVADTWARYLHDAAIAGHIDLTGHYLLDVIYDPWPSPLSDAWRRAGGSLIPGYLMLLFQAVPQVMLMTGQRPSVQPMRQALYQALEERGLEIL
ncbi:shikimate dehydrogenase family protein [Actinomyces vulturis]|uniref:shikimate dehydrogenase family protein n=1 Tax=Actinomyces vulturis TaxID=1857645 RepID=UPI00082D418A|nr:shikimate dehydrogenase [Actinomyces vulturis]